MLRRSLLLASIALVFLVSSCAAPPPADEGAEPIRLELGGEYRGRYWVTHNDGTSEQRRQDGPVWMKFENGEYQIDGDYEYLPPVGGGSYHMDGSVLVLDDTSIHTANFDWSLILKGRFEFDMGNDGVVRLTQRDLENGRYHELELRPEGP